MTNPALDLTPNAARNWKPFVADYLVWATRNKDGQEAAGGYQVKRLRGKYRILFGGMDPGYGAMDAETLYSWANRTSLSCFAGKGDALRADILAMNGEV